MLEGIGGRERDRKASSFLAVFQIEKHIRDVFFARSVSVSGSLADLSGTRGRGKKARSLFLPRREREREKMAGRKGVVT